MKLLTLLLLLTVTAGAADLVAPDWRGQGWYRASQVAFVGAHVADIASTGYGGLEANPIMATNGRLGAKGMAIKVGYVAGFLALQEIIVRRKPRLRRLFSVVNACVAGGTGAIAARNMTIPR